MPADIKSSIIKKERVFYCIMIIATIILGILSRQFSFIPLCLGDVLYSIMAYFGIRLLFTNRSKAISAVIALLYCYCIECSQLYRAEWLVAMRNTHLGHYILGQGFSWSDLAAYTIGVSIVFLVDQNRKIQK